VAQAIAGRRFCVRTLTTEADSLTALVLAQGLLSAFSGRGLVPQEVVAMKDNQLSVVL
jgi:hypothetical protein